MVLETLMRMRSGRLRSCIMVQYSKAGTVLKMKREVICLVNVQRISKPYLCCFCHLPDRSSTWSRLHHLLRQYSDLAGMHTRGNVAISTASCSSEPHIVYGNLANRLDRIVWRNKMSSAFEKSRHLQDMVVDIRCGLHFSGARDHM